MIRTKLKVVDENQVVYQLKKSDKSLLDLDIFKETFFWNTVWYSKLNIFIFFLSFYVKFPFEKYSAIDGNKPCVIQSTPNFCQLVTG